MSAPPPCNARVERYLVERRRLGFDLRSRAYALRSFARHVSAVGHRGPLTVEIMADWARRDSHGSNDPRTWARRLKKLRSFTRWLQQFEPRTEVPDDTIFGRLPERQAPHIYSEQEIVDLLAAARRLGPAPGLRGVVFETLFGLIACYRAAGLRGAVAAQRRCRSQARDADRPPDQVRQVAPGADAPEHAWRHCAAIAAMRDLAGESARGRCRVLRRHARPTAGHAAGRPPGGSRLRRAAPAIGLAQPRRSPCPAHPRPAAHLRRPPHRCSGRPRASTSIRRCCRCRPTSGMRW